MTKTKTFLIAAGALAAVAALIGYPKLYPVQPDPTAQVPRPAQGGAVRLDGKLSHPFLAPGTSDIFLTADATGADVPGSQRIPVNLAVVLDRSGSMAGQKLEQAKAAAQHLVDQLSDADRLTLIHYGSDVQELPGMSATAAHRSQMHRFIARIQDEGGTNIGEALRTAEREVTGTKNDFRINRIILITDGQPTEGMTDSRGLIRLVQDIRSGGVNVSAVGVGADFNEDLLQQFAEYGAGSYAYLADTSQLAEIFQRDLKQAGTTVARNVELSFELPSGVELDDVLGHRFSREGNTIRVPITDLSSGQLERVVAKMTVHPSQAGRRFEVANLRVSWTDVLKGGTGSSDVEMSSTVTDRREEVAQKQDKEVAVIATRALASANLLQAADALSRGDGAKAREWVHRNEALYKDAEKVAGHDALAQDEAEYAPPAEGFGVGLGDPSLAVKKAKVSVLKGVGRISSTY